MIACLQVAQCVCVFELVFDLLSQPRGFNFHSRCREVNLRAWEAHTVEITIVKYLDRQTDRHTQRQEVSLKQQLRLSNFVV